MKIATIAMGIGLSAFLMTGCGGNPVEKVKNNKPDITGKWIQHAPANQVECINNGHGISDKYMIEINATNLVYNQERYSEEGCDPSSLDTNETYNFTYKIGDKITLHQYDANGTSQSEDYKKVDGYELDLTLMGYTMHHGTVHSIPDWKTFYNSFRLDDKKLHMAMDGNKIHDGKTKENRVIEIGTGYFWTKQ